MYAIEFVHARELATGADREDLRWTRLRHRYATEELAEQECSWLHLEDDGYAYRVVPLPGD